MPLYGGFAGSFGLLMVLPLDLKQVELVKGLNSTLYSAGAIAGLVNFDEQNAHAGHASVRGQPQPDQPARNRPQRLRGPARSALGLPAVRTLLRYRVGQFTFALNGENLLDYRQTRREKVVLTSPFDNPSFRELWAPVEGRVVNLSLNVALGIAPLAEEALTAQCVG